MNKNEKAPEQTSQQPVFSIEKIYLKDLSLEVPHAPQVFLEFYNVTVTVTVTAKMTEERVLFLNEVAQSGIFRIANIPDEDVELLLAVAAPNILFPYARETVSNTITRSGFPPVMLAPINFEAMYQAEQANAGNA